MTKIKSLLAAVAFGVVVLPVTVSPSLSHEGELSAHGARHAAMKAIGAHMKALGAVAKGSAPVDEAAKTHAMSLASLAGTFKYLFPEEPIAEKSRALPAIWERWDEFAAISDEFTTKSYAVVTAVSGGKAADVGAALGEVGKTCGGCHKPFRGPRK